MESNFITVCRLLGQFKKHGQPITLPILFIIPKTPFLPVFKASIQVSPFPWSCLMWRHWSSMLGENSCGSHRRMEGKQARSESPLPHSCVTLGTVLNPLGRSSLTGNWNVTSQSSQSSWESHAIHSALNRCWGLFSEPDWIHGRLPHRSAFKSVNNLYCFPLALFPN